MDKIELKKCPKCLREFKGILKICPWCGTPLDQITKVASSNSNSLEFIQIANVHPTITKKATKLTTNNNNKKASKSISKFKIKFIPGFRTGSKWKMLLAMVYYIFCLLMAPSGIQVSLFSITIPFFVFNLIKSIKTKAIAPILTSLISFIIMICCLFI